MNKTAAKICIAAFSILFVFCLAALVAATMFQSRTSTASPGVEAADSPRPGFATGMNTVPDAPSHTHTTDPAKEALFIEEITKLDVSMISGKINLLKSADASIRVAQYVSSPVPEERLFTSSVSGKTLIVSDGRNGLNLGWGLGNTASFELDVYLPEKIFEEIRINTTSADADAQALNAKSIIVESTSGDINVSGSSEALSLSSTSGDLHFSGSAGVIKASNVSGLAQLLLAAMPSGIQASSTSGDVCISLPENDGFTARYHKVSGDLRCSFPTTQDSGAYVYKKGGTPIDVSTVSGDLEIYQTETESV